MTVEEAIRICGECKKKNPDLTAGDWMNVGRAHQVLAAEYLRVMPDLDEKAESASQPVPIAQPPEGEE